MLEYMVDRAAAFQACSIGTIDNLVLIPPSKESWLQELLEGNVQLMGQWPGVQPTLFREALRDYLDLILDNGEPRRCTLRASFMVCRK